MTDEIKTFEDFEREVNRHDLTHGYSDDHSVYMRGSAHYSRIRKAAEQFDRAAVERVWNAMVDQSLVESDRAQFYWRWPEK